MRAVLILIILISQSAYSSELKSNSYGSVKIGMPVREALTTLKDYTSDKLSYDEPYGCYYLSPVIGKIGVQFMVVDEKISRFDIDNKQLNIKTEKSIGIGSTKEQVIAAYSNALVSPHPYTAPEGEYLEVQLPNGNGIIFETDHDVVTSFRLGSYPAVGFIEGCQ